MSVTSEKASSLPFSSIPLERDSFCRTLIRELSGVLEDIVGIEEASGFISIVGQRIGADINNQYKKALNVNCLNKEQIARAMIDLKARIKGDFYIVEKTEEKVVFANKACPFEEKVIDRQSLCMMTSNVFGTIAAENTGYSKVVLEETIAKGDAGCRVVVYFSPDGEAELKDGREYFSGK